MVAINSSVNLTVYTDSFNGHEFVCLKGVGTYVNIHNATLNTAWNLLRDGNSVAVYGDSYIQSNLIDLITDFDTIIGGTASGCQYFYTGCYLIGSSQNLTVFNSISDYFPLSIGSDNPSDPGTGDNGYNDSSFKGLVTELFDHLFNILLYGEDEDYDGTDVDDSIEWLDDLSEDMEDITDKLNQAPTYISNGFTAITNAQSGINDFFSGISTAVPVLYYGIVGILNIIIIRKIIGR